MIGLDEKLKQNIHENGTEGSEHNPQLLRINKRELDFSETGSESEIDKIIIDSSTAVNQCPFCQRKFKRKTHLNGHVRLVHEGIRPHKCGFCERSFGLPRTLRIHIMGHTKERPFTCNICQKSFRQKTELNLHMNNHLSNSEFRCPICSRDRASQEDLDSHISRHNN
ncbi:adult enhancer factor 1-like [Drosophila mojavensis]|uniref:adult enhancer factor 1-like n=1 Tax=Drosophila mojavensis TaxID=7230 RepID=UPI0013EEB01A|nr:adult enhancer factor 1-like [Drosophila mojavensis]